MNNPAIQADLQKSAEIAKEYAMKEQELERRYNSWAQLTEE
jgi:ATP-binding cassette subfamily F protein 3